MVIAETAGADLGWQTLTVSPIAGACHAHSWCSRNVIKFIMTDDKGIINTTWPLPTLLSLA